MMKLPGFGKAKPTPPLPPEAFAPALVKEHSLPTIEEPKKEEIIAFSIRKINGRLYETIRLKIVGNVVTEKTFGQRDARAVCLAKIEERLLDLSE